MFPLFTYRYLFAVFTRDSVSSTRFYLFTNVSVSFYTFISRL